MARKKKPYAAAEAAEVPGHARTRMAREEMQRLVLTPDLPMAYAAALIRAKELGAGLTDHERGRAHYLAGVALTATRKRGGS